MYFLESFRSLNSKFSNWKEEKSKPGYLVPEPGAAPGVFTCIHLNTQESKQKQVYM
jgi:hypothetical protein